MKCGGSKGVGGALCLGEEGRTFTYAFHTRKNQVHRLIPKESQIRIIQTHLQEPESFFFSFLGASLWGF